MSYIGNTSRLIRAAWITIVVLGFSCAGYLIWESFDNWEQNPVATTVSTHPIDQVTFPKIYVCPPKHTYTNLNHDIVNTKNVTLTEEQIDAINVQIDIRIEEAEVEKITNYFDLDVEDKKAIQTSVKKAG